MRKIIGSEKLMRRSGGEMPTRTRENQEGHRIEVAGFAVALGAVNLYVVVQHPHGGGFLSFLTLGKRTSQAN